MSDLEEAIKSLKSGKCRDPEGSIREVFKEESMGDDLKRSMLMLFNILKKPKRFQPSCRISIFVPSIKEKGK